MSKKTKYRLWIGGTEYECVGTTKEPMEYSDLSRCVLSGLEWLIACKDKSFQIHTSVDGWKKWHILELKPLGWGSTDGDI